MSRASRMAKEGTSCQQLILARGNSARELCAGQLVASRAGVVTAGGITCFGLVVVVRQHTPVSGSGWRGYSGAQVAAGGCRGTHKGI
jgi:hypothetical protein